MDKVELFAGFNPKNLPLTASSGKFKTPKHTTYNKNMAKTVDSGSHRTFNDCLQCLSYQELSTASINS